MEFGTTKLENVLNHERFSMTSTLKSNRLVDGKWPEITLKRYLELPPYFGFRTLDRVIRLSTPRVLSAVLKLRDERTILI